jgi:hypothetical protein
MFGRVKLFQLLKEQPKKQSVAEKAAEALLAQVTMENFRLRDENEGLRLELEMTDDLLTDAAGLATRYQGTLVQVSQAIDSVSTPNGTTRKLGRIASEGLGDLSAAPLGELVRR